MKSFEEIERTEGSIVQDASTSGIVEIELGELTPEERMKRRQAREREAHQRAQAGLPEDWEVIEEDLFLVLNHADDKDADKLVEQGEAVFRWCEKTFPYLIDDTDYLRKPILRICNCNAANSSAVAGKWPCVGASSATMQNLMRAVLLFVPHTVSTNT